MTRLLALLLLSPVIAFAGPADFPEGSAAPGAPDIQQRLSGRTFDIRLADDTQCHVRYGNNGDYDFKSSQGFTDHGDWKAGDGRICSKGRKIPHACNDVRVKGDDLYLTRDNGEIIQFVESH
ncbi:hypothetical protein [Burkholderia anthina]|uniref:hypothetical protein n=1 Tax=Burkholderia anthina TaxID=179879 RepID=UPI001589A15F|nr:hypothetical protein [Burkholderia anthina]